MIDDRRSKLTDLFDRARVNGVAYLFVLAALGSATRPELSNITGEDEDTLGKYLVRMESRGLCVRVRDGKADRWHLHPTAAATLQLPATDHLLPKISVSPSSSSDQISDQSVSDQIPDQRSDQSEEEDRDRENRTSEDRGFKAWLCKYYGLTGDKATAVVSDDTLTPEDLIAWMCQVGQMKQAKFKFNKSPEAYALHCLLITDRHPRRDEPNAQAVHLMQIELDQLWSNYTRQTSAANETTSPAETDTDRAFDDWQIKAKAAHAEVKRIEDELARADYNQRPTLLQQCAEARSLYLEISRNMP